MLPVVRHFVAHFLSLRSPFARRGNALELFDSAFFNLDLPEFVTGFALRNGPKRAELFALHEGASARGFAEFRLLAVGIAFELLEVRTFLPLANALFQTASFRSGWHIHAFLAGIALSALRRRVLKRAALLLGTTAFVLRLFQFLALFAFDRFELAMVGLNVLTFESFTATIVHFDQLLAFLASGLDDFGTDFPNASEVGTFASVVR